TYVRTDRAGTVSAARRYGLHCHRAARHQGERGTVRTSRAPHFAGGAGEAGGLAGGGEASVSPAPSSSSTGYLPLTLPVLCSVSSPSFVRRITLLSKSITLPSVSLT